MAQRGSVHDLYNNGGVRVGMRACVSCSPQPRRVNVEMTSAKHSYALWAVLAISARPTCGDACCRYVGAPTQMLRPVVNETIRTHIKYSQLR